MYYKLSLRNVKRSIRDYAIYFVTLTFGVCIFYVFNSIESQQAMLQISTSQRQILKNLSKTIGYISVFISVVLGFLIIYANRFLIKRRKRELGIYMTLGMDKSHISRILMVETFFIGLVSLAVGLTLGIFASQGLALITAKIFEVKLKTFEFIFSQEALWKSIMYFGIMFIFIMIFNTIAISKYKLIDLINANRKNERLKIRKLWISVILFIIGIACLGAAYYLIIKNKMMTVDMEFTMSILLGSLGTLLFFMSLSGFLLKVIQSNKKLYLKNLNMFVLRQINSKINTTYISMTIICIMLLITIGTISTGMGMAEVLTGDLEAVTPYDASVEYISREGTPVKGIYEAFKKENINIENIAKDYVSAANYTDKSITYGKLLKGDTEDIKNQYFLEKLMTLEVGIMKLSHYNKLLEMQGKSSVSLENNQFIINSDFSEMEKPLNYFLKNIGELKINGKVLKAKEEKIQDNTIMTSSMKMNFGTIVVQDSVVSGLNTVSEHLAVNYKEKNNEYEEMFIREMEKSRVKFNYFTKLQVYEQSAGLKIMLSYISIYIGIVFLITSAAVLALQQLSEAADNIERYILLRKIGVEEKMINRSIFTQIAIYFMMPLSLAVVHSIVGVKVIIDVVQQFGEMNILSNVISISVFIILIYGSYFLATYLGSKNMLKISGARHLTSDI
ncbi:FtsX-like permease family protein [Clostridium polynesiense]|uniref:FtsX-like permease family protein n=1 Tax=Clostridium polynesiense TaxID=1325933 RepID=UPI00058BE8C8|nr:FtsX-like permease family protein [Clostridium polynesiense]